MVCMTMCYIPPPVDSLVFNDPYKSKMVALSVGKDMVMWEFQEIKRGIDHNKREVVYGHLAILFHPQHDVLFVADGIRKQVLIIDPRTGDLIQSIDLPLMDRIDALGLFKNQLIMLHAKDTWTISYFNLL